MAPHSSTLAWKIPWMEEPGGLQSMGSLRVGHDWVTSLSLFTFMHWRRKWQPTPVFLPGESQGQRSLVGCCLWVAQSQTRLKWLSSGRSSSSMIISKSIHVAANGIFHSLWLRNIPVCVCLYHIWMALTPSLQLGYQSSFKLLLFKDIRCRKNSWRSTGWNVLLPMSSSSLRLFLSPLLQIIVICSPFTIWRRKNCP